MNSHTTEQEVKKAPTEETTAVVKHERPKVPMLTGNKGLHLNSLEEMYRFSSYVIASGLAPKGMDTPETILIAVEMGLELGMPPMQALQCIAVINGRPSVWGDAVPGLVRGSGLMESYTEEQIGRSGEDDYGYRVTSKRVGDPKSITTTFTVADAKRAGLWGKSGPWTFYSDRMLKMRARTFNLRDNFPDVLKGLHTAEEVKDMVSADFEVIDDRTQTERVAAIVAPQAKPPEPTPPEEAAKKPKGKAKEEPAPDAPDMVDNFLKDLGEEDETVQGTA